MALHIISHLSVLVLLIGAYLTAAMPICNEMATDQTITTQTILLKQLQSAMNLSRDHLNVLNKNLSCSESGPDCIGEKMAFDSLLCKLTVLYQFAIKVNDSLVSMFRVPSLHIHAVPF